ncbi:MAG: hypothetical protein V4633_22235 [Pseudomonadota bacterium]
MIPTTRHHPNYEASLPITAEEYRQLQSAATATFFELEFWEIGSMAIRDWLANNQPQAIALPAVAGYQWKNVFLPNGTVLRTVFNGKNFHCHVKDDGIKYEGKEVSPSGFANAAGGTRRNAWKVVWVLMPNTSTWTLAGELRGKRRPRGAKA